MVMDLRKIHHNVNTKYFFMFSCKISHNFYFELF